jgi:Rieske Fe-S protein
VDAGLITCNCHFSQYHIADGSVARGPSTRPLAAKTATVQGDHLVIS